MAVGSIQTKPSFTSELITVLYDQWNKVKGELITKIALVCIQGALDPSSNQPGMAQPVIPQVTNIQSELEELKKTYENLTQIYHDVQTNQGNLLADVGKTCLGMNMSLLGLSAADTTALTAGLGMGISSLFSNQESGTVNSTGLKGAAVGLIIFSQICSKVNDWLAYKKSVEQKKLQGDMAKATEIILQKGMLDKTAEMLFRGQMLIGGSRDLESEDRTREVYDTWQKLKKELSEEILDPSGDAVNEIEDLLREVEV